MGCKRTDRTLGGSVRAGDMGPPQAATSLEYGNESRRSSQGYWGVNLYPEAGEGRRNLSGAVAGRAHAVLVPGGHPGLSMEATCRARTRVRRYCTANRLNRLGTLTYAPPFWEDPNDQREHVGEFFSRLRDELAVAPFRTYGPGVTQGRQPLPRALRRGEVDPANLYRGRRGRTGSCISS